MAPASHDVGQRRGFVSWIEKRLPLREFIESQLTHYYAPKNFNAWYYFGVLALVVLVSQFATGIVLTMFYKPGAFFWLMPFYSKIDPVKVVPERLSP
jgi:quinol-cytochrome oxidoreductase complex cytochrome b subunit